MTATIPSSGVPKSLQAMIADAKTAIANWDVNEDADDPIMQGVRDWTLRLSQGQYDDDLYWKCVAEDCEENGDWQGAITAYRRILDPQRSGFDHWKACLDIAFIYNLLGDANTALVYYQRAAKSEQEYSSALWRMCVSRAIWTLLRLGRLREARKHVSNSLASIQDDDSDFLGTARLLIAAADCELYCGATSAAHISLKRAWNSLDSLGTCTDIESNDEIRNALGVRGAYELWWRVEALRRRFGGDVDGEIDALCRARDEAAYIAGPSGWPGFDHDLTLMRTLFALADAYDRHNEHEKATAARVEAEAIRARRKFPLSDDALEIHRRLPLLIRITNAARLWWQSLID